MVALGLVLVAICARMFLRSPRGVSAAPGGSPTSAPAETGARRTNDRQGKVRVDWQGSPTRDPFKSTTVFPPAVPVPAPQPATRPVGPTEEQRRAARIEELVKSVKSTIKLDATVQGAHPLAIINGKTYRAGDEVNGFALKRIGARDVVLEKDGFQLLVSVAD
jgi:hypothetical protein